MGRAHDVVRLIIPVLIAVAIFAAGMEIGRVYGVPFIFHDAIWTIGILEGSSPLTLGPPELTSNPVLTAQDVKDKDAQFVADPFMITHNGTWYMFVEVLNKSSRQGDIGLATSRDGRSWAYQGIVLDEPFHLSYPLVFEWGGEHYLIPESSKVKSVRLYRAVRFPYKWAFVQNLLTGDAFADPTTMHFQGRWWMFTYLDPGMLWLYHAPSLTGPWEEHKRSPVVAWNKRSARPGGRMTVWNGKLIRFAQDDEEYYGKGIRAFEVLELTPSNYQERELLDSLILPRTPKGWNATGMHHIDPHEVAPNHWISVVDGRRDAMQFGWRR